MQRREFLIKTAKAAALAAAAAGTGAFFHNRPARETKSALIKQLAFEVPIDKEFPQVTLAVNEDTVRALAAALDGLGGIRRFIRRGDRVTIKPNIGWDRSPEQAANTSPVLVSETVRLCLEAGASRVIVTDVSCNDPRRCFVRSGIGDAAAGAGASVLLPEAADFVQADLEGSLLTDWPVLRHFIEADRLINMPIVKQHSLTDCTIGLKNLYGILGGNRSRLHQQIDQSIVDLAAYCTPTLTIIDATRVLQRGGPQGGSLDDVTVPHAVLCATDRVAADSRAVEFLGKTGAEISHLVLAEKAGLGRVDYVNAGFQDVST